MIDVSPLYIENIDINFEKFEVFGPTQDTLSSIDVIVSVSESVGDREDLEERLAGTEDILDYTYIVLFSIRNKELADYVFSRDLLKHWKGSSRLLWEEHIENFSWEQFSWYFRVYKVALDKFSRDQIRGIDGYGYEHYNRYKLENLSRINYVCLAAHGFVKYKEYLVRALNTNIDVPDYVVVRSIGDKKKLIVDNQVQFESNVLKTTDTDEVWTGTYHRMAGDSYMTGDTHSTISKPLRLVSISDPRVGDYRATSEINSFNRQLASFKVENFKTLRDSLFGASGRNNEYWLNKYDPKQEYFSDLNLSVDVEGNYNFQFDLSYDAIIDDYAASNALFQEGRPAYSKKGEYFKIRNVRVMRRRVINSSPEAKINQDRSRTSNLKEVVLYDSRNPVEELVVQNRPSQNNGAYKKYNSRYTNTIRIIDSPIVGIKQITGTDSSIRDITYGNYQYIVELEIEDGSSRYIKELIKKLEDNLVDLKLFKSMVMSRKEFYNKKLNMFNFSYLNLGAYGDTMLKIFQASYRSKNYIDDIQECYTSITGDQLLSSTSVDSIKNSLDVFNGSPDGIESALYLHNMLLDSLYAALPSKKSLKTEDETSSAARVKTFKVKKYFKNDFASLVGVKNYGMMDYFDVQRDVSGGLPYVPFSFLTDRVSQERERFQPPSQVTIEGREYGANSSRRTFLNPSRISMGGGRSLDMSVDRPKSFVNLASQIASSNSSTMFRTSFLQDNKKPQLDNEENLLNKTIKNADSIDRINHFLSNNFNMKMTPVLKKGQKTKNRENVKDDKKVKATDFSIGAGTFSEDAESITSISKNKNNFNTDIFKGQENSSISIPFDFASKILEPFCLESETRKDKMKPDSFDKMKKSFGKPTPRKDMSKHPDSIKSLVADEKEREKYNNFYEMYYEKMTPVRVKVLTGYKKVNGRYSMKDPIWEDLDSEEFNPEDKEYVCKMEKFVDAELNVGNSKLLDLNINNKVFLLRGDQFQSTSQNTDLRNTLSTRRNTSREIASPVIMKNKLPRKALFEPSLEPKSKKEEPKQRTTSRNSTSSSSNSGGYSNY